MLYNEIVSILDDGETAYLFVDDGMYYVERASLVGYTTDSKDRLVCKFTDVAAFREAFDLGQRELLNDQHRRIKAMDDLLKGIK